MRVRTASRGAAVATLVTIGALLAAPTARAGGVGGGGGGGSTGDGGRGASALCARVPRLDARLDKALTRLDGDAGVNGSITRIERRIATAESRGRPQVATYLKDVLTTRRQLAPELRQRRTDLARVKAWCDAHPAGPASPMGPTGPTGPAG